MFNKEKLKNLFKSKSTIIKDEFDKIGETSTYELDILEIGDNVIVQQYAGTQIADDGHEYLLVNERDVIAKVSE